MKTPITFVAVRDRKTIYKTIKIEHDFEVIPAMVFNGQTFPETSIERQVIDYLDSIDKTSLMEEHGFAIIHKGLGYNGDECKELEITNWNTSYVPEIHIKTKTGVESMEFKVDEFIALAEIFKQLKQHRR